MGGFLDAETARIDALIRLKRRQRGLIDERWAAVCRYLTRVGSVGSCGFGIEEAADGGLLGTRRNREHKVTDLAGTKVVNGRSNGPDRELVKECLRLEPIGNRWGIHLSGPGATRRVLSA